MKSIIKYLLLTFLLLSFTNCSAPSSLSRNTTQLQKIIRSKACSVLFIWTGWCGVSESIIPKTYLPLADSVTKMNINANVILLCDTSGLDKKVKSYNIPGLQSYYIARPGNGIPFVDRLKIKNFIEKLFPGQHFERMKKSIRYGIPLTIIVDSNMNVLTEDGPQDVHNLLHSYLL